MRFNYVKRTCKRNRQELLNRALEEELEYLRKKIYPWKRQSLIWDDIEIKERNFYKEDMQNTLGLYQYNEKECKHTIYIDKLQILNVQKISLSYYRKQHYEDLKQIIRHELIHAFVKEKWEYKCKKYITGKERDASPIFLAILYFCDGYTNHNCRKAFYKTNLYEFAKYEVDTYTELKEYLIENYLLKYIEAIGKIKEFTNRDKFIKQEEKDYWTINNTFQFAPRINGMEKFSEVIEEDLFKKDGEIKKTKMINREWHIGCNVEPSRIIELYNKKQDCEATYLNTKKQLIVLPKCAESQKVDIKDCKFITVKEEKNF